MDLTIAKAMMMIMIISNHLTLALLVKVRICRKKERTNINPQGELVNVSAADINNLLVSMQCMN